EHAQGRGAIAEGGGDARRQAITRGGADDQYPFGSGPLEVLHRRDLLAHVGRTARRVRGGADEAPDAGFDDQVDPLTMADSSSVMQDARARRAAGEAWKASCIPSPAWPRRRDTLQSRPMDTPVSSSSGGLREAWGRFSFRWWLKTAGISAYITGFMVLYFTLLRHPLFPVTVMPLTE